MDSFGIMAFALAAVVGIFVGAIKIPLSGQGLSGTTFSLIFSRERGERV